jgi:hypothetical protein
MISAGFPGIIKSTKEDATLGQVSRYIDAPNKVKRFCMTVNNVSNRPSPSVPSNDQATETNTTKTQSTTANTAEPTQTTDAANADSFETKANALNLNADQKTFQLSPAGQKKAKVATDKYHKALENVLTGGQTRGMALANEASGGKGAFKPGDKLEGANLETIKTATQAYVMEMPIGALSAKAQGKISDALAGTNLSIKDVGNKSLNDLKGELGDKAKKIGKDLADDLKTKKPGVYYGLAVTGAAAAGVYGYKKGSAAIEKLGIKPEYKKGFFDNKIVANAKASWEADMKNPELSAGVNTKLKTSEHGRLAFGANAKVGGKDLKNIDFKGGSAKLSYSHGLGDKRSLAASLNATFDTDGHVISGRSDLKYSADAFKLGLGVKHGKDMTPLGYDIKGNFKLSPKTSASTQLNFNEKFDFTKGNASLSTKLNKHHGLDLKTNFDDNGVKDLSAKYSYNKDNWNVSAGAKHDFINHRSTANLSAGYELRDNVSLGIIGSTDGLSDHRIGAGLSIKF